MGHGGLEHGLGNHDGAEDWQWSDLSGALVITSVATVAGVQSALGAQGDKDDGMHVQGLANPGDGEGLYLHPGSRDKCSAMVYPSISASTVHAETVLLTQDVLAETVRPCRRARRSRRVLQ